MDLQMQFAASKYKSGNESALISIFLSTIPAPRHDFDSERDFWCFIPKALTVAKQTAYLHARTVLHSRQDCESAQSRSNLSLL